MIFVFAAFSWVHDGDHGEVREGRGGVRGGGGWAQFRPLTSISWAEASTGLIGFDNWKSRLQCYPVMATRPKNTYYSSFD